MARVRSLLLARRRLVVGAGAAAIAGFAARARAAGGPADAPLPFAPQLAGVYTGQVDPALCLVSEKYDGVRALWDGRVLRFRSGRVVQAPPAWLATLPGDALDGELWLGRGRFEALSGIARHRSPLDSAWAPIRYMAFELPGAAGRFVERAARLADIAALARSPFLVAAPQERVADAAALARRLAAVTSAGGEGLMLHLADAPVSAGRGDLLLKLKPHLDAEAVVVAHRPGTGKYRGQVGALLVEAPDGRRFLVGSGLSDSLRREPPPPGSSVTYRYRELTGSGLPRFPTYLRRHDPL